MQRISGIVFIMFFICLEAMAQSNISAVVEVNYNTYSHDNLSDFQQELSDDIDEVNLRVNDDFGANVGYTVGVKVEDLDTQFFFSYNSTGGKLSYSDYSGIIRITQLLKAYTVGGEYQFPLTKKESKDQFYLGGRGMINYSALDLKSYSKIEESESSESIDFNSVELGVGIRFIYELPISVVRLRLNAGYDLLFGGDFWFSEDREYTLENNKGEGVKTGWSGFRTGIGVMVPF